jgi:hypothetical protein
MLVGLLSFQSSTGIVEDGTTSTARTYESVISGIATVDSQAYHDFSLREKQVYRDVRELKALDKHRRKKFWYDRRKKFATQPLPAIPGEIDEQGLAALELGASLGRNTNMNTNLNMSSQTLSHPSHLVVGGLMEGSSYMMPPYSQGFPPQNLALQGSSTVVDTSINDISVPESMTSGAKFALSWTSVAFAEEEDEAQGSDDEQVEEDKPWVPEDENLQAVHRREKLLAEAAAEGMYDEVEDELESVNSEERDAAERAEALRCIHPMDVKRRLRQAQQERKDELLYIERLPRPAVPPAGVDVTTYGRIVRQRPGLGDFYADRDAKWHTTQFRDVGIRSGKQIESGTGRRRRTTRGHEKQRPPKLTISRPAGAPSDSGSSTGPSSALSSARSNYTSVTDSTQYSQSSRGSDSSSESSSSESSSSESDSDSERSSRRSSRDTTIQAAEGKRNHRTKTPKSARFAPELGFDFPGDGDGISCSVGDDASSVGMHSPMSSSKRFHEFTVDTPSSMPMMSPLGSHNADMIPVSPTNSIQSSLKSMAGKEKRGLLNARPRYNPHAGTKTSTSDIDNVVSDTGRSVGGGTVVTGDDLLMWPINEYTSIPAAEFNVSVMCSRGSLRVNLQERSLNVAVAGGIGGRRASQRRRSMSRANVYLVHNFRALSNAEKQDELRVGDQVIAIEGIPVATVLKDLAATKSFSLATYVMAQKEARQAEAEAEAEAEAAVAAVSSRAGAPGDHHHHGHSHKHDSSKAQKDDATSALPLLSIKATRTSTIRQVRRPSVAIAVETRVAGVELPKYGRNTLAPSQLAGMNNEMAKGGNGNSNGDDGSSDGTDSDLEQDEEDGISISENSTFTGVTGLTQATELSNSTTGTPGRVGQRKNALYRAMFFMDRNKNATSEDEDAIKTIALTIRRPRMADMSQSVLAHRRELLATREREERMDKEDDEGLAMLKDVVAIHPI